MNIVGWRLFFGVRLLKTARTVCCSAPALIAAALLASCNTLMSTPSLRIDSGGELKGPTVAKLVRHLNCEIAEAYIDHVYSSNSVDDPPLWRKLDTDNFVAAVDFTLTVTDAEAANPSFSFVQPLTSAGGVISPIVPSTAGMGATSGTYNRTLAVGFQLDGSQDRDFDVQYIVDMHSLIVQLKAMGSDSAAMKNNFCGTDHGGQKSFYEPAFSGLQGKLGIGEIIGDGLHTLDYAKSFNIYGSGGPTRTADISQSEGPTDSWYNAAITSPDVRNYPDMKVADLAGGPPSGATPGKVGGGGAGQAGSTTFSSKIDFSVVEGINGGPSWSVLDFKGPGGGGAGGGGGAAAGGAGGAGGGGGGGQPLSLNRTALDSLTVTFTPTCRSDELPLEDKTDVLTLEGIHQTQHYFPAVLEQDDKKTGKLISPAKPSVPEKLEWELAADQGTDVPAHDSPNGSRTTIGSLTFVHKLKYDYVITINAPLTASGLVSSPSGTRDYISITQTDTGTAYSDTNATIEAKNKDGKSIEISASRTVFGAFQWSGFVSTENIRLLGKVTDPRSLNVVGTVTLSGPSADSLTGSMTAGLFNALLGETPTKDYWQSIANCDLATIGQGQVTSSAVQNAVNQNLLSKFPSTQRRYLNQ